MEEEQDPWGSRPDERLFTKTPFDVSFSKLRTKASNAVSWGVKTCQPRAVELLDFYTWNQMPGGAKFLELKSALEEMIEHLLASPSSAADKVDELSRSCRGHYATRSVSELMALKASLAETTAIFEARNPLGDAMDTHFRRFLEGVGLDIFIIRDLNRVRASQEWKSGFMRALRLRDEAMSGGMSESVDSYIALTHSLLEELGKSYQLEEYEAKVLAAELLGGNHE